VNLFAIIGRYFWLLCLAIVSFNYIVGQRKVAARDSADPRLSSEVISYRRLFAVASAVPWVVMGVGILLGGVPNIWYYFRPQDHDPFVLAWFGSLFIISISFAFWVFFLGGAEKVVAFRLIEVNGLRGPISLTVGRVKLLALLGSLWIALWVCYAASMNVPVPK
jgi:hypothetical protein